VVSGTAEIWARYDAVEARLSAPLSERLLDLAALRPGDRVLDLASGRGEPALGAARRVAPHGEVIGLERDADLVRMAEEIARRAGGPAPRFCVGDATVAAAYPPGPFDAVTCRWGIMYFADPFATLRAVRAALRPGGAFVAAVWGDPARASYYAVPRRALSPWRESPPIDPQVPSAFRFADPARFRAACAEAGLAVDHEEDIPVDVYEAEDVGEMIAWALDLGVARLLQGLPEAARVDWERNFVAAMAHERRAGRYVLGGVTRLVRARPA
jgi:ubiquinone/menaquinone biosynthesis C-methylase UbiE